MTEKERAIKTLEQIMEQIGAIAVDIGGLMNIGEALEELPKDWIPKSQR